MGLDGKKKNTSTTVLCIQKIRGRKLENCIRAARVAQGFSTAFRPGRDPRDLG